MAAWKRLEASVVAWRKTTVEAGLGRSKFLVSDWTSDAFTSKTISSALFMFFATFTSTLALGEHITESTNGLIGLNEYLMMNSLAGMAHSVLGCQPLLVLRPTGPITLLFEKLLDFANQHSLPFWPFFAWTGLFVGLLMFLISAFELCKHVRHLSLFTENIFATFIGMVYINDGIQGMIRLWGEGTQVSYGSSAAASKLLTLNMTIGFTALTLWLSTLQSSKLLTFKGRMFLKDYALTISLFVSIFAARYLNQGLFPVTFIDTKTSGFNTTSDRPWNTDLTAISGRGVLCAALAAFPVVVFFYLDQNISSSLCQKPEMKLSKGSYYHSSFACMAFFNTVGPLFGLPFVTGSLPHSPQFVLSLAETDEEHRITRVRENRLAPLLCYFLIGLPLLAPSLLEHVPKAAVFGTLIFVGIDGIQSTQLYERVLLMVTDPRFFPKTGPFANVPLSSLHLYTLIQIALVAACWMVNADFGLYFPLFFISLVPVRWFVVPYLFTKQVLDDLDHGLDVKEEDAKGTCAAYGCTSSYKPESRCQCNSQCADFGNCCDDYVATCTASTTSSSSEATAPATPATSAPSVSPGPPERSSRYRLKWSAQGESFFDNWNFLWEDHNHGSAQYLLEPEAKEESVIEATRNFAIIRAGRRSPKYKYKRMTTRMESKRSWKYFLTLIKFSHVPYGCGVWPALFTLAPNVPWPNGGELDILEYVNMDVSKASFHTGGECKLSAEKVNKYGPMPDRNNMDYDCVTDYPDRLGCAPNKWMKSGTEWAHSPGILATQWTESFLKIFYIPEHEIPQDILADNPSPDKTWDDRWLFSYYPFTGTKCIFEEQKLMMQINFCGDWAGKVWGADGNCNWRVPNCRAVDPLAEYAPDQDCCTQWIWDENDRFGTETYLKERAFFNISYIKVFQ
ncbi:Slc4a1 [Symbiodinium necroappetens]|uniref:Slc4a1 protein n=1 Tax=Symbiodinium necroappetens TaxID=1628268 RepID=A0A812W8P1_9DINO|nr:Slc4a1 [Symbiodinium necroappetens]